MSRVHSASTVLAALPLIAGLMLVAACDDGRGDDVDLDAPVETGDAGPPDLGDAGTDGDETGAATCAVEELAPASEGANHTAEPCSQIPRSTNPPASGTHFSTWPAFRAYDKPVPWNYLLHAMEHGAVVIAYNCPTGCPEEVAAAKAVMESIPRRSACAKPRPPVIVTPDPMLSVRFAAAAWGHILRASCFDREAFTRFTLAHVNKGPELIPGDCGAVDREVTGWCTP